MFTVVHHNKDVGIYTNLASNTSQVTTRVCIAATVAKIIVLHLGEQTDSNTR